MMPSTPGDADVWRQCSKIKCVLTAYTRQVDKLCTGLRDASAKREEELRRMLPGAATAETPSSAAVAVGGVPQSTPSHKRQRSASPPETVAETAAVVDVVGEEAALFFVCEESEGGGAVRGKLESLAGKFRLRVAVPGKGRQKELLPPKVTHVVSCDEPFTTGVYVGLARGCWVVSRAYVDALVAAQDGVWVDEADYGFRHSADDRPFRGKETLLIKGHMAGSYAKVPAVGRALGLKVERWRTSSKKPPATFSAPTSLVVMRDGAALGSVPSAIAASAFLGAVLPPEAVRKLTGASLSCSATVSETTENETCCPRCPSPPTTQQPAAPARAATLGAALPWDPLGIYAP